MNRKWTWRIAVNMKTRIQHPPNQSECSGFVTSLSHFLENALVRTGGSVLGFGMTSWRFPWYRASPTQRLGDTSCAALWRQHERVSVYRLRDHTGLELPIPTWGWPHHPSPGKPILRKALLPSWNRLVPLEETKAALSGSKNSWLGKEIFGKLSFPGDLSVTLFNPPVKSQR